MKTYARAKAVKIEQAGVTFYDCEWEATIEKYGMKLVGTFAMPRNKGGKSIMTCINEHVRLEAEKYLKDTPLFYKNKNESFIPLNHDLLQGLVMQIFTQAIDGITKEGESLFDIDININKKQEKELENEIENVDKHIKQMVYELEAKKKVEKIMEEELKKYGMGTDRVAPRENVGIPNNPHNVGIVNADTPYVGKPVNKPKKPTKGMKILSGLPEFTAGGKK